MKKLLSILVFMGVFFNMGTPFASDSVDKAVKDLAEKGYKLKILFPLNVASKILFTAKAPKGFQLGHQHSQEVRKNLSITLVEFIPKNEKIENWSQIVTYEYLAGFQFTASSYGERLYKGIAAKVDKGSMSKPEFTVVHARGYEIGKLSFSYRVHGQKEIFVARIYSGRYDTAVQQHTIRVNRLKNKKYDEFFLNSLNAYGITSNGKIVEK